jgi:hypothetical protein
LNLSWFETGWNGTSPDPFQSGFLTLRQGRLSALATGGLGARAGLLLLLFSICPTSLPFAKVQ